MRHALLCFISLLSYTATCQPRHLPLPEGYASLSVASRLQPDAFSFLQNPAVLSNLQTASIGFFAEQRYLVAGLAHAGISAGFPGKYQSAGIMLQYLGGPQAHRAAVMLSAAQKLGKEAALGVQVRYYTNRAAGYASENTLGYAVGAQLQLAPQVQAAINMANPHAIMRKGKRGLQQAAAGQLAVGYDLSETVFLTGILEKTEGVPAAAKAAFQYRFGSKMACRVGVGTGTGQFFLGCGYIMGRLRLDVFTSLHGQLGFSPGLQLSLTSKHQE